MKNCKRLLLLASSLIPITLAHAQSNTPPIAFSQSLTATQGSSLFIVLTASDADGDSLTYRIATPPSLGYLTGAPPNVLYVSTTNFSRVVTDSFTFVARDGQTDSAPATISIALFPQTASSNASPVVSVVATDAQAAEPPPTNNGTFTFFRTGNLQSPLTVLFRISGTATLNTDYQTSPSLATGTNTTIYFRTIPANSNSATLTVIPLADTNVEPTETVVLTLFTNSAYALGYPNGAIVTILNTTNSSPPQSPVLSLVTTDPQAYEVTASGDIDTASFAVMRTGGSNFVRFPITVSGTATYGVDYYTVPGFPLSSNSSTAIFELQTNQNLLAFTLYPIQDHLAEGTETAIFTLGTNASYTLGTSNQSVISISDGPPSSQLAAIIFPPDGSVFASPESIAIKAEGTNALELRIYADDQLLAVSNPPAGPATFMLSAATNFSPGQHTVYAVGTNRIGLVSNTYTSPPVHFQVIAPLARPMAPTIGVAPNSDASYVIDANGALFDWGAEAYGALADGVSFGSFVPLPQQIPLGDRTNRWIKVASGGYHTLALDSSGTLYSAGKGEFGELGRPNALNEGFMPVELPTNLTAWQDIAAGSVHSLVLTPDGRLFAWGFNGSGQLGNGRRTNSVMIPAPVPLPAGVSSWNAIAAGQYFSIALANDGNLYTCGSIDGSSTDGKTNAWIFLPVPLPVNVTNWLKVAAGPKHVLAVAGNGALYAWGVGSSGELGNGDFTNSPTPVPVISRTNVFNWIALGAGFSHSLGLANDGNLYSWGSDNFGELGPDAVARAVPALVPPPPRSSFLDDRQRRIGP